MFYYFKILHLFVYVSGQAHAIGPTRRREDHSWESVPFLPLCRPWRWNWNLADSASTHRASHGTTQAQYHPRLFLVIVFPREPSSDRFLIPHLQLTLLEFFPKPALPLSHLNWFHADFVDFNLIKGLFIICYFQNLSSPGLLQFWFWIFSNFLTLKQNKTKKSSHAFQTQWDILVSYFPCPDLQSANDPQSPRSLVHRPKFQNQDLSSECVFL